MWLPPSLAQATVELGVDIKATRMIVTLDVHVCTKFLLFVPEYNLRWPIISIHIELHSFYILPCLICPQIIIDPRLSKSIISHFI